MRSEDGRPAQCIAYACDCYVVDDDTQARLDECVTQATKVPCAPYFEAAKCGDDALAGVGPAAECAPASKDVLTAAKAYGKRLCGEAPIADAGAG